MTKNVFSINLTQDKKNTAFDGEGLIVAKTGDELEERFEKFSKEAAALLKKANAPGWMTTVQYFGGMVGAIVLCVMLRSIGDITPGEAWRNAWWLIIAGAIGVLACVTLSIFKHRIRVGVENSDELQMATKQGDKLESEARAQLGIPKNAKVVDILLFRYTETAAGVKILTVHPLSSVKYINFEAKLYVKNGLLCIADNESVFSIPLSGLRGIRRVNEKVLLPAWNKEISYRSEAFKDCKITSGRYGITIYALYVLSACVGEQDYEITFPAYERDAIVALTGLTPDDSEE